MTWLDVLNNTSLTMQSIKSLINWIINFLTDSTVYDALYATVSGNAIISAVNSIALTLCVLFFLIDFFQKSLHLQWVTWENIMMFSMKLFLAKIMVSNAAAVLKIIQNGFSSVLSSFTTSNIAGEMFPHIPVNASLSPAGNSFYVQYFFSPTADGYDKIVSGDTHVSSKALFYNAEVFLIGLIMKIVFAIIAIIVVARIFELLVYACISPIPLATLSCEGLQDVGKGFLKSFAAVCLQAAVIVVMILIYSAMLSEPTILKLDSLDEDFRGQLKLLLCTFIFAAGVMQSGNWSKKICGAM